MNQKTLFKLEYDKIIALLEKEATSFRGGQLCRRLKPMTDINKINTFQEQTAAAFTRIVQKGLISFGDAAPVEESMKRLEVGGALSISELLRISRLLGNAARVKAYGRHDTQEESCDCLDAFFEQLEPLTPLANEIERCIPGEDEVSDDASSTLKHIRRSINGINERVHATLTSLVNGSLRTYLQDPIITMRGDRYCIPVKAEYRGQVQGLIHDQSSTGSTLFIEPMAVVKLNNDLKELYAREQEEIQIILAGLSEEAAQYIEEIRADYRALTDLDFIFARGALALSMKASRPVFNEENKIHIREGRHPLLDPKTVVPITVTLGEEFDLLIVTGPNTGGKTVSLKTVGLFCLMGQAGLHIPAADGSHLPICPDIFADIGDEQSIEQSLSTFSSHMKKIVEISQRVTPGCLVLFDELGAGTDPVEGAALATAIIEDFRSAGAIIAATTHYSELKLYALSTVGVENASCEFDVATLSPTYRLLIGVPGRSNAFAISEKLGLSKRIIDRSKEMLSEDNIAFEDVLSKLEENRVSAEKNSEEAEDLRRETERLKKELAAEREKIEKQKDKIYDRAREKAEKIIQRAQQDIDRQIEEIKELRKKNDDMETLRQMQEVRRELGLKLKTNKPPKNRQTQVQHKNKVDINKLRPGADVLICDLGDRGSVISINKKDGTVVVQVGIMKITAKADNIALLPQEDTPSVKKERKRYSGGSGGGLRKAAVKPETDLRGMMLEEAEYAVDKYLDEAAMAGLGEVSIIHGKGTGVLRNGIREMLRRHPHVKSFRRGKYGEGEDGVTVVELK